MAIDIVIFPDHSVQFRGVPLAFRPKSICRPRRRQYQRKGFVQHRRGWRLLAERDPEVDPSSFDEGAAQVRRLMSRDRKEFAGPDFEELLNNQFSSDSTAEAVSDEEVPEKNTAELTTKPASPFSSTSSKPVNPFGTSVSPSTGSNIFPAELESKEDIEPWWSFINSITMTQIVLACSFILISATMLGTFVFVLKSGAIHFNE